VILQTRHAGLWLAALATLIAGCSSLPTIVRGPGPRVKELFARAWAYWL
jgi:hypothetical protein